ncbi:hypothetical protein [Brevibacterium sp. SMBL_HHYL_HB1]|uniref:hypothetical protein n=1 Tax=Brevibacterium sp. SMBL_HHYL_HB1 TaxID=2777556 RepID=UPI001BA6DF78|nr:hypothetical protein [Brevibacterium sp. SMBL_HHYL_HB1]QUL79900.1 hypothetical protein IG171_03365 [Brevibacterium sp. SMBL_HHYL_HB1]
MRIRSIKPEFWRSDDVNAMCIEDRLLFIGLWSYVDDNGVGIDRFSNICADLFAHDLSVSPHDTLMRVQEGLERLQTLGVIVRYSVGGKDYLEIVNWSKHQKINRPSPGRYPRSEQAEAVNHDTLTESSLSPHESSRPGTGEQGNRGTGEQGTSSSEVASDSEPEETRPDVEELLDLLDSEIEANGNRLPKRNKTNRNAMRLLLDRDEATPEQVAYVIRWCQADSFWKANILSADKLRAKFGQLVAKIKADAEGRATQTRNKSEERIDGHLDIVARMAERENEIQGELI